MLKLKEPYNILQNPTTTVDIFMPARKLCTQGAMSFLEMTNY